MRVLSHSVGTTLCDPMDYSLPGFSVHGDSPGKNTGVGCHALFLGIFPTWRSNPGLLHCRQILYHLSHTGAKLSQWLESWATEGVVNRISRDNVEPEA